MFMSFKGSILKEQSYDPYYKVEFTYDEDELTIEKGFAEIVRKQPKLEITYDENTQEILGEKGIILDKAAAFKIDPYTD